MESAVERQRTTTEGLVKRCPECGASNKPSAQWCGQCLNKFVTAPPPPPPPPPARSNGGAAELLHELADERDGDGVPYVAPVSPAYRTPTGSGEAGAVRVEEGQISWTCVRCDTVNEFDVNVCVVCGATFADSIRPPEEPRPARDPNKVALISLFMPGAGHAYLGMWGEGFARAVISAWVVLVAVFAAAQDVAQAKIMAALFGMVATGLWMIAAHDSYREASGTSSSVILKRRVFLYLVLGLLMLSIIMIFSMVMGAR